MDDVGVKDTIAFKIVRQVLDHIYGSETEMDEKDFLSIYESYLKAGGSWESLIRGSMGSFDTLKSVLDSYMDVKINSESYGL